jgi:NAD(P)H-nitrite reductase large subunit
MKRKNKDIICKCNEVPREAIEEAIRNGADTMNKIFDATTAGVGPCGGSCRKIKTGNFPAKKTKPVV